MIVIVRNASEAILLITGRFFADKTERLMDLQRAEMLLRKAADGVAKMRTLTAQRVR